METSRNPNQDTTQAQNQLSNTSSSPLLSTATPTLSNRSNNAHPTPVTDAQQPASSTGGAACTSNSQPELSGNSTSSTVETKEVKVAAMNTGRNQDQRITQAQNQLSNTSSSPLLSTATPTLSNRSNNAHPTTVTDAQQPASSTGGAACTSNSQPELSSNSTSSTAETKESVPSDKLASTAILTRKDLKIWFFQNESPHIINTLAVLLRREKMKELTLPKNQTYSASDGTRFFWIDPVKTAKGTVYRLMLEWRFGTIKGNDGVLLQFINTELIGEIYKLLNGAAASRGPTIRSLDEISSGGVAILPLIHYPLESDVRLNDRLIGFLYNFMKLFLERTATFNYYLFSQKWEDNLQYSPLPKGAIVKPCEIDLKVAALEGTSASASFIPRFRQARSTGTSHSTQPFSTSSGPRV